ncbi:MAG TPA: succinate dehydrogenase assembly factor 2 [Usitatibacter sp.]|nr:succinate dehydrogenase assembly factor 2 [Usitatibacter sp.]
MTAGARALERLRWQSRRGLLELDLVLERFWSRTGTLAENDAQALERLLAIPDNDLLDCVMGRAEAPEAHLRPMVEKLRAV